MSRDRQDSETTLQDEIRKQFGSAGTSRFMHALPVFQVERRIPERFLNLLTELERAEDGRNGRYSGNNAGG
jgi:hypothetical protein